MSRLSMWQLEVGSGDDWSCTTAVLSDLSFILHRFLSMTTHVVLSVMLLKSVCNLSSK